MIPDNNPFRPSFGVSPLALAGRELEVSTFLYGLYGGVGSMQRAMLISGSRGVGKTVLLNEFEESARQLGWVILRAYPDYVMLETLRDHTIPEAMAGLDHTSRQGRTVTGVSIAGLGSVTTQLPQPAPVSLLGQLRQLSEVARAHEAGILITLDEVQAAHPDALGKLATAIQDLIRDERDVAFAAAGLTFGIELLLDHPGTTFMRRAHRLELGSLPDDAVASALQETAHSHGRSFTDAALADALHLIQGYPYLVQLVGALAWTRATMAGENTIGVDHLRPLHGEVAAYMGNQVHKSAVKNVPPGEVKFLRAMAGLEASGRADSGAVAIGDIASALGKPTKSLSVWRKNLIERDLIRPAGYGHVEFVLPYMGEFLQNWA